MLRRLVLSVAAAAAAWGALLPERWPLPAVEPTVQNPQPKDPEPAVRGAVEAVKLDDAALASELGFDAGERSQYTGGQRVNVTVWRFKDPTCALVYYLGSRPADGRRAPLPRLSSQSGSTAWLAFGNYVVRLEGWIPQRDREVLGLLNQLPRLDSSALPALPGYLPLDGLISNSERYILGPTSLERYESRISPGMAAFSLGAEGVTAKYATGETLTIFNYPVPNMARERAEELRKLPGAAVKRTGPLVAVALGSADANAAERLLAKVNYQAQVTWNEATPNVEAKAAANTMLSIFALAGIAVAICVAAGLGFGAVLVLRRRFSKGEVDEKLTVLGLDGAE
jgi:hypothetical protein